VGVHWDALGVCQFDYEKRRRTRTLKKEKPLAAGSRGQMC
jgi:hypothetical protein